MIQKKTNFLKTIFMIALSIMVFASIYLFVAEIPRVYAMELDGNEYDQVFLENVEELAKDNYGTDISVVAEKELLYDLNLQKMGYIYDFTVNEEKGYAVVVNTTGIFEMPELFFNAKNPFSIAEDAKRIYVGDMTYLYFADENYYFAKNDVVVNDEGLNILKSVALYSGYADFTYESEVIYFTSRNEDRKQLAARHPYITDSVHFSNECAVIAGANVIQYWDRFKTELIPNYTPGGSLGANFLYYGESDVTNKVVSDLYYDMGTNTDGAGTTIDQFTKGMTKYIKRNGNYIITYGTCISSGKFNFDKAKQYFEKSQPIVLFLSTFNITTIYNNENNSEIYTTLSKYNHAMVAFGYRDISYTLSNGTKRYEKYLSVATGISEEPTGYFNISYKTNIDDAIAINLE